MDGKADGWLVGTFDIEGGLLNLVGMFDGTFEGFTELDGSSLCTTDGCPVGPTLGCFVWEGYADGCSLRV